MKFLLLIIGTITFLSCQSGLKSVEESTNHKVLVTEVLQASVYTYLHVNENKHEQWLAASKMPAKVGETYYYKDGLEMNNFESKELNRTFESIIFVDKLSNEPIAEKKDETEIATKSRKPKIEKKNISIEAAEGGITIAGLYSNKNIYEGKTVKIKGQVTKFNPEIMDKNWIHIQDGTDYEGSFDLTVTSDIEAKVGDIICVEGKIALNKDFGYGYFYEVILEDAEICKK